MSEYRRFVAYMYEYQKGEKKRNCGYVKVHARNGACRFEVRIQTPDMTNRILRAYGFVRRNGWILGLFLGEGMVKNRVCELHITTAEDHIGEEGYRLSELCGFWLDGEGETYISVWDEEPIDVSRFTLKLPAEPENDSEELHGNFENEEEMMTPEKTGSGVTEISVSPENDFPEVIAEEAADTKKPPTGLNERWDQFVYHYPPLRPLVDETAAFLRILPKDISFLGRGERDFMKNPFVQQGYIRYGYLLLGRRAEEGFILGVPGMYYDAQDKHLARMYGFPEFLKAERMEENMVLPEGEDMEQFGYWYHRITEEK